jgi:hypothetical protein
VSPDHLLMSALRQRGGGEHVTSDRAAQPYAAVLPPVKGVKTDGVAAPISLDVVEIDRTMRVFALRPSQPSTRRVYQPAALPERRLA